MGDDASTISIQTVARAWGVDEAKLAGCLRSVKSMMPYGYAVGDEARKMAELLLPSGHASRDEMLLIELAGIVEWAELPPPKPSDSSGVAQQERVMTQFNVGDVVMLKSGGPAMTVIAVVDDQAACARFAGDVLVNDVFPGASLVLVAIPVIVDESA